MKRPLLLPLRRSTSLSRLPLHPSSKLRGISGSPSTIRGRQLRRTRQPIRTSTPRPPNRQPAQASPIWGRRFRHTHPAPRISMSHRRHSNRTSLLPKTGLPPTTSSAFLMRVLPSTSGHCRRWAMAQAGSRTMTRHANSRRSGGRRKWIGRYRQAIRRRSMRCWPNGIACCRHTTNTPLTLRTGRPVIRITRASSTPTSKRP